MPTTSSSILLKDSELDSCYYWNVDIHRFLQTAAVAAASSSSSSVQATGPASSLKTYKTPEEYIQSFVSRQESLEDDNDLVILR